MLRNNGGVLRKSHGSLHRMDMRNKWFNKGSKMSLILWLIFYICFLSSTSPCSLYYYCTYLMILKWLSPPFSLVFLSTQNILFSGMFMPPPPPGGGPPPPPPAMAMREDDIFVKLGMKRKKKWNLENPTKRTNWKSVSWSELL